MYPRLCGPRGPRFIIQGGVRGNPFRLFRVFRGLFIGGAGFGATSVSFRVFQYPRLCGLRGPRFIIRGGVRGNSFRLFRVFRGLFIGGAGFLATSVSFRVFQYPRLCGPRGPRFIIQGGVRGNPFRLFRVLPFAYAQGTTRVNAVYYGVGFGATSVSFRVFPWLNSGGGG